MKNRLTIFTILTFAFIVALGLNGCSTSEDDMGTLSVLLTDAPFPTDLVDEANVTIIKLEAREADGGVQSPYLTL